MTRLRRWALSLALLAMVLTVGQARAASPCTAYLSAPGPIPLWQAPGTVLCFHAGTYPHDQLRITALSAVYMAAPGEQVRLVGTGSLELYGHDFTLSGLDIDAGGSAAPAVVLRGDREQLSGNEIHGGRYNLVDVRGNDATLISNQLHHADSGIPGSDAQCVDVLPTASRFQMLANTVHDCSGDGVQLYYPNSTAAPLVWPVGDVISGNVFYRGTISYTENAIDTKIIDGLVIENNDISGYGFEPVQLIAGGNPSVIIHKFSRNVRMTGNTLHDSAKGVEVFGLSGLDAGAQPVSITVSGNTFIRIGPGYLTNVVNGISITTQPNSNYPAGLPTLTPSATATASPSQTPTQTATATLAATDTATPTATETATASATATIEPGCWDLRHSQPVAIPCP